MSDPAYFVDGWQTKEVLDPEIEKGANESIIQMVFDHKLACVCHVIFSNYTWKQEDIQKLIAYYETVDEEINEKLLKLQRNSEHSEFEKITKKFGLLDMPIYSKGVDTSEIVSESSSRVYHDPKEYLNHGHANESELYKFVSSTLKKVLEPLFTSKEIRNVLKELISSLMESRKRDDPLGANIKKELSYEFAQSVGKHNPPMPLFCKKLVGSITNFIGYFALHTIRQSCYANFGVDGELKFYNRDLYKKALDDIRNVKAQQPKVKSEKPVKNEKKSPTKSKVSRIKPEKKDESDDDFCEIIEPEPVKKVKKRLVSESTFKESKDFPEQHMLNELDEEDLPMIFKSKFRKLVERNQMLRDAIRESKELLQIKIAEKKQKMF